MLKRMQISARGLVQGVGFRPFIYHLATKFSLAGFVQNDTNGVFIDIEGRNESIDKFLDHLVKSPPPHGIIEDIVESSSVYGGFSPYNSSLFSKRRQTLSIRTSFVSDMP